MSNVRRSTRCKVCDALIGVKRLRRHPCATLCGSARCAVEHRRRRHNHAQQNWRIARGERDPAWRDKLIAQAGVRYRKRKAQAQARAQAAPRAAV